MDPFSMPAQPFLLETEHLIWRPVEAADLSALVDLWSDPQVTEHMGGPRDREKLAQNLTEIARAIRDHAFKAMGVERLIALIEPGNQASEKVARKVGMRLEKEVVRPGGSLRHVYAIRSQP
jgi:RimJ/RimL family protein N-acetyltransferase